ncbi:MAG: hypothetical protein COB15_16990 [Flavobacteriales bacterium]|nr:MAG: hypothetical protein COB15_16990 [Flavobacteriales bacterium]
MKNIILIATVLLISFSANAQKKEKTYKVLAGCGQCQLEMISKTGCDLAIQYAGKKYWVDGTNISDHGDEHASDGFCQTTRKAEVKGTFDGNKFIATSFTLIDNKKKKSKK